MRNLGAEEGVFVLGILDCCREKINLQAKGFDSRQNEEEYTNCVISFGCPPSKMVNADSMIAEEYFMKLLQFADPLDGSVLIPGNRFYRWRPN